MITLFRNIRERLLARGNLRKYILYTLGEILLVVVGILIALQVNNWNEERILENNFASHLEKKLDNLREDQRKLQQLNDYRVEASAQCTYMLQTGVLNVPDVEVVDLVLSITIERRFLSSLQKEDVIEPVSYSSSRSGTAIKELEIEYIDMTNKIMFDESRLNNFSENLEADIWRGGFFNDNRDLFVGLEQGADILPELIISDANGLKSLEAILRRNEIISMRLSDQYTNLLNINQMLVEAIETYLQNE